MSLLYERSETADEVVIRYKYWPIFYITLLLLIPLTLLLSVFGIDATFVGILCIIILILFFVDHMKPNREIRKAIKESNAQISGSKLSFANPFTAVIKKKQ